MAKRKISIKAGLVFLVIIGAFSSGCFLKLGSKENYINRQKGLLFATNTNGYIFFAKKNTNGNTYSKGFAITNQYNKCLKQNLDLMYKTQLPEYLISQRNFVKDDLSTSAPELLSVDTIKIFSVEIEFRENRKDRNPAPYEFTGKETVTIEIGNVKKVFSYSWLKSIYIYSVSIIARDSIQ